MSGMAFLFPALHAQDPETLGDFRLVARLGEGGMGQVFLALSPGGLPAAVKVIRSEFAQDAQFARRFTQEVRTAQKVRGAHIAPLLDADPTAERPWLATTYVAGPSLQGLVATQGPLPTGQVMLLAFGIAHALADIHAANVVHRDLKPGNILLDETGVKVIDFGIVKSLTQSVTYRSQSTRVGTPLFMSPEQAMGRTVGPASDMFALGSTLYSLATAREAFAAENEWGVAYRIVADHPDLSRLTSPLRGLITACLNKDPEQRPTPQQVQAWCEQELGDALGPGAWMGITGARESIQQRTAALRVVGIHGPSAPDTAASDHSGIDAGDEESGTQGRNITVLAPTDELDIPEPRVRTPTRTRSIGSRGVIAVHMTLILVASGALLWAAFLPIVSQSWTAKSSGDQVAHLTIVSRWHDAWKPQIPVGISGLDSDWILGPGGVFGTALGLVACVLFLLALSNDPEAKAFGAIAHTICWVWISIVAFAVLFVLASTLGFPIDDEKGLYDKRWEFLPGGWLLVLANCLLVYALVRTRMRAGLRVNKFNSWK